MGSCGKSTILDDASGGTVIGQHLCSEFPLQSIPVQRSCSAVTCSSLDSNVDCSNVLEGCEDLSAHVHSESASFIDAPGTSRESLSMVEKNENIDMLLLEKTSDNDNQTCSSMCCEQIKISKLESFRLSSEEKSFDKDGHEMQSEFISTRGSPKDCAQQGVQKDEKINILSSTELSPALMVDRNDTGVLTDACNHITDFRDSGTPLDSESMTDLLVDCHKKGELEDLTTNADLLLEVVNKCDTLCGIDADSCKLVSPSQGSEVPADVIYTEVESASDQLHDQKVGEDDSSPCEDFVDKESITDTHVQVPSSPGCQKIDADSCKLICPQQGTEVPTDVMYTDVESASDQLHDQKVGEDGSSPCEDFVDKESIIDTHVQAPSSSGCQRIMGNLPVADSPGKDTQLAQGIDKTNIIDFNAGDEMKVVEQNFDVVEMKDNILQVDDKSCKLNDSSMETNANCTLRKTISPESGLPSVVYISNSSSKDVLDLLPKGKIESISYSSVEGNSGEADSIIKVDCVPENKCSEVAPLPFQRNSRRSKSGHKTQTKRASRKCKNKVSMPLIILEAARKKRSCFSKPARSSIWGLVGNINKFFERDNEVGVDEVMSQELRKVRGTRKSGKANKNGAISSSVSSMKKCTTRVRLKIKLGKEVNLSCSNVLVPEVLDGSETASSLGPGFGSHKVTSTAVDKFSEEIALGEFDSFKNNVDNDAHVLNGKIANKHLESTATLKNSDGVAEELCPGTSPDSEVINSIPEVHVGERHPEGVHDAILGSKEFNSLVEVTGCKRGKKKDKLKSSSSCIVENGSQCLPRKSKTKHSKNRGHKKNFNDAVCSVDLLTSNVINAASNFLNSEELSTGPLPLSGEIELEDSTKVLKVKSSTEVKTTCNPDVNHELSESQGIENLQSSAIPFGRKLPNSLKSSKVSKTKSKASDSMGRKKAGSRRREKQQKPVKKSEVKRKGVSEKVICEVEDRSHTAFTCKKLFYDAAENGVDGDYKLDAIGKINTDDDKVSVNVSNLDMALGVGLGEQHVSPHNAWVRCDDCHKWRRIPVELADQIEETKCTWTCKDSNDKAFADCSIPQEKSNAEINAELGLSDGSGEEDAYEHCKNYKELEYRPPMVFQESTFTHILTNEFLHRSRKTQTIDEIMVCHCKSPAESRFGCGDECLNRMLNIECVQGTCPCGDCCSNQQFQQRKYASLTWFKCGKKGYGLKALEDISKGKFLIEYVGEVLDVHAYEARQREYAFKGHRHFYFMTLNGSESKVLNLVSVNSSGHFPLFSELSPVAFFSLGHLASQVVTSFFFLHFFTVQFLVAVFFSLSGCCFPAVSRDSLLLTSSKQTYLSPFIVMASSKSSSQEASSSNANEFSGNAENSVLLLTRHKLTGQNYLHWSRSMIMFITGKGKEDYLTISTKPQPDDPKFKTWNAENQMVMSWLINSMDLEIGQDFMFFASAAEIWKAAKESYSDVENTAELFEIKGALHDLKQGELSVPQYFNTLNRYWLQLDMFECPEWKCSEDAETYKKLVEKERIYKFLLGLNKSLDNIRGRILSVKPLPSLREVLSTVRHEESRRKLMLGSLADSDSVNGSVLAVHGASHNPGSGQKKGRPWCDHCHRTGHVKDKCWKLHGKPSDWKSLKDKNIASGLSVSDPKESSSSAVFSKEQMANYKVRIADGSLADVTGIGEISLSDSITLKSVLFVPKLKCNLLSVAKLAHDSNCKAEFTHSSCSFQDVDSGKMIGNARVREDLYRFEMNKEVPPNKQSFAAGKKEDSLKEDRDIMLWLFVWLCLNSGLEIEDLKQLKVIDASAKGNLGRFINHSCDPNCRTEKWMVNGEICIGLFALRDIKQGEEVTFDYNYVRVFGAAAKKCHCGSPLCRGYIGGGDPLDAEVIVQGDSDEEFPEPVMLNKDGEVEDNIPRSNVVTQADRNLLKDRDLVDKSRSALVPDNNQEKENSMNPASAISQLHGSLEVEDSIIKLQSSVHVDQFSQQMEDVTSKSKPAVQQGYAVEAELPDKTSTIQRSETCTATIGKGISKSKSEIVEGRPGFSKSNLLVKTSRPKGSVKKGKVHASHPNGLKTVVIANKLQMSSIKPRKVVEGSSNGRFEAVQEKLKELLDEDGEGGISKRKDATKGYLKLLLLTVASGDRNNGEAIQSNRDLSMILGALLKTKSRAVLNDIINKNGLQMLHNIMKQYRRDFKKIPILRKLLKVLEHLAASKILTFEHINGGPPCRGMESFRESMLSLTEHDDKQVHQIARSFRDRWIPRPFRKHGYMDRDDYRVESHRNLNCNRFSASQSHRREQDIRPTEANDSVQQSTVLITSADAGPQEGCSALSLDGSAINGTKRRKRKSRWDQPAEMTSDSPSNPCKKQSMDSGLLMQTDAAINSSDGSQNATEDFPPGFSCPVQQQLGSLNASPQSGDLALQNAGNSGCVPNTVIGHPKGKFNSLLSISYGMPLSLVQQYGTPHAEIARSWVTAPGIPFIPFPPLPPYPRDNKDCQPSNSANAILIDQPAEVQQCDMSGPVSSYSDDMTPSTTGASSDGTDLLHEEDEHLSKRMKGSSCDLGRRYFRQQKWNNSKIHRPWFRKNAWGCNGNNTTGGMCSIGVGDELNESKVTCSSEDVICRAEKGDNNV
ncbi:histone-lysine N-methyltransferase ASHH2 isoform X1 [Senna tora]|uniref:Histone-lysine N-methyltransferase ASHH2 isoform X1 n=1 Tax=Senna tora TaxID=362788 RepID=A0A834TWF2_9FABA|nr:histone-lysine N-methyltransferase ASHH2 isoform X1 [Senna tora]